MISDKEKIRVYEMALTEIAEGKVPVRFPHSWNRGRILEFYQRHARMALKYQELQTQTAISEAIRATKFVAYPDPKVSLAAIHCFAIHRDLKTIWEECEAGFPELKNLRMKFEHLKGQSDDQ